MRLIDADELKNIHSINKGDFNTVESIQKWIDKAPTIRVRGEKKKKEPYIPPCIEPPKESDLPTQKEFEFTPIRPRKKIEIPEPMKETIIRFDRMQEAYDKLVAAEPEGYPDVQKAEEVNEWELAKAGYKLALQQAREAIEAEFGRIEDPVKSPKATGLLRARSIIREMEKP